MNSNTVFNDEFVKKPTGKSRLSRMAKRKQIDFMLLVAPAFSCFALLMLYPLVRMFYVSMFRWHGIVKPKTYIGFGNYTRMFNDPRFIVSLKNTFLQLFITLPVVIPVAFMLGFFLSHRPRGHRILRTVFFSPVMLSVVGLSMMFSGLYLPDGIINVTLRSLGFESLTQVWLANLSTARFAVFAVEFWSGIGFFSVLFFAALSNLPSELFEAARIDGANYWVQMWSIAFPLVLDFVGVALILEFTWIILGFGMVVLLLTRGGPGTTTMTLGYLLYEQAFRVKYLGYSQAIGVFIFIFGILGTLLIRITTRRDYQF